MDYKTVLEHFKRQAEGKEKTRILKRNGKNGLIVLDVHKTNDENLPKLQVVVPAEAATMRAESQLTEDIKQNSGVVNQSTTDRQSVKRLAKRKATEVKEVKDIFHNKRRKK